MPLYTQTEFTPDAVRPVECLKEGWEVIKEQYWTFVGLILVALLIGNLAPLGILMAPMMCGIYLALLQRMRGQRVEFEVVFKGFDFFGAGVIAMLLHLVPVLLVLIPFAVAFLLAFVLMLPHSSTAQTVPASSVGFIAVSFILLLTMAALLMAVSVVFTFAYPLIVEKGLSGVEAVKLSTKAGLANFQGLLALLLLNALLGLGGVLCCCVGLFLVLPVTFAATACAYRQAFGPGTARILRAESLIKGRMH